MSGGILSPTFHQPTGIDFLQDKHQLNEENIVDFHPDNEDAELLISPHLCQWQNSSLYPVTRHLCPSTISNHLTL